MIEEPEILAATETASEEPSQPAPQALVPRPKSHIRDYFEQALVTVIIALFLLLLSRLSWINAVKNLIGTRKNLSTQGSQGSTELLLGR